MNNPSPKLKELSPNELLVITADPQAPAARFSSCGQYLVAGSYDGRVRRWKVSEPVEDEMAGGEKAGKNGSPKSKPKKGDKSKEKAAEYKELPSMRGHGGWVEAIAHHPDPEKRICVSGDSWGGLQCWRHEEQDPKLLWAHKQAHDGWLRSLVINSKGDHVATCGLDRKVRLWKLEDGKQIREFSIPDAETYCVQFHPQRDELLCGDMLGRIHRWNYATGKALPAYDASGLYLHHRLQDVGGVRTLSFDQAGKTLAAGGTRPKNGATVQGVPTVMLIEDGSGKLIQELSLGATNHCFVHDAFIHPRGFVIAVTSGTPGAGQLVMQIPGEDKPFLTNTKLANCHSLTLHPDGNRFAITTTNKGSNGNGRRLNKDGEYEGNKTPIHVFDFQWSLIEAESNKEPDPNAKT